MSESNLIKSRMPLLARGGGSWAGTYTFITPAMEVLDRYSVRTRSSFPEDGRGGQTYRLESEYVWLDGRIQRQSFDGFLDGDAIVFDNGRIAGRMHAVDDQTLYLTFGFTAQPDIQVCEMIQFARDAQSRARTWHWLRKERLYQLTLVDEWREEWAGVGDIG